MEALREDDDNASSAVMTPLTAYVMIGGIVCVLLIVIVITILVGIVFRRIGRYRSFSKRPSVRKRRRKTDCDIVRRAPCASRPARESALYRRSNNIYELIGGDDDGSSLNDLTTFFDSSSESGSLDSDGYLHPVASALETANTSSSTTTTATVSETPNPGLTPVKMTSETADLTLDPATSENTVSAKPSLLTSAALETALSELASSKGPATMETTLSDVAPSTTNAAMMSAALGTAASDWTLADLEGMEAFMLGPTASVMPAAVTARATSVVPYINVSKVTASATGVAERKAPSAMSRRFVQNASAGNPSHHDKAASMSNDPLEAATTSEFKMGTPQVSGLIATDLQTATAEATHSSPETTSMSMTTAATDTAIPPASQVTGPSSTGPYEATSDTMRTTMISDTTSATSSAQSGQGAKPAKKPRHTANTSASQRTKTSSVLPAGFSSETPLSEKTCAPVLPSAGISGKTTASQRKSAPAKCSPCISGERISSQKTNVPATYISRESNLPHTRSVSATRMSGETTAAAPEMTREQARETSKISATKRAHGTSYRRHTTNSVQFPIVKDEPPYENIRNRSQSVRDRLYVPTALTVHNFGNIEL
ncbi:hypothetical protein V1264_009223 [Littorina saxatilis]|uniref:Uncharacterized protein n=2 Tax=Littorina saxatilis TaxID=31220 RepID=A0AAN9AQZ6_9CAEN